MPVTPSYPGTLELKSEKTSAHDRIINSVAYNNDGSKIVSACNGGTIKVWDAGGLWGQNHLFLASP